MATMAAFPGEEERAGLQRRTLLVLAAMQVLGGIGLGAGVSVAALIARDLLSGDGLTGIPVAVATAGGACAAVPLSRLMDRSGRRAGLTSGYAVGATGALVVVGATAAGSFVLLVLGMALFGAGNTSSLLARYAGADLAAPEGRGRAVSTVLFSTTFGAVAGPNLVEPMGAVGRALGIPELAGPFVLTTVAYAAAGLLVLVLLRPDPLLVARASGAQAAPAGPPPPGGGGRTWGVLLHGRALVGLTAMVGAQFAMVAMMTMTPVNMRHHGHSLSLIGFVISVHIAGMFFMAPVSGFIADRVGRPGALRLGAIVLASAGVLGAVASPHSSTLLTLALFLLGFGWSLSLVSGSALLTDAIPLELRARAQGDADLLVGMAGATGGLGSGLILALAGFAALGLLAAAVAAALLAAGVAARRDPADVWS
jgi:MFS family permease